MKWPRETLQNLPYFWNTKTQIVFSVYHFEQLWVFFTVDAAVCVDVDQAGLPSTITNLKLLEMKKKLFDLSFQKYGF